MRFEYKYYVPNEQLDQLRSMIMPFVKQDGFAMLTGGEYTVRSIYMDDPDFTMYHSKQAGLAHRMKVRLRGYNQGNDQSPVFMEIKRKYEGPIHKNRSTASFAFVKELFKGGADLEPLIAQTSNPDNTRRFFYQLYRQRLKPVINVIYDREPYLGRFTGPANDVRITMDKNLRSVPYPAIDELYGDERMQFASPNHFVLEVKFNLFCPPWVKPILAALDLKKEPASKYVLCIDSQPMIKVDRPLEPLIKGKF